MNGLYTGNHSERIPGNAGKGSSINTKCNPKSAAIVIKKAGRIMTFFTRVNRVIIANTKIPPIMS